MAGEAVTAATVLAGVSTVGTMMTVVGAVTGSKELMRIGGAMSLVGGAGSLIAGGLSAATGAAAEGVASDVVADGAAEAAAGAGGDAVNGMDLMSDQFTAAGTSGPGGFTPGADLAVGPPSGEGIVNSGVQAQPAAETASLASAPQGQVDQLTSQLNGAPEVQGPAGAQAPVGAAENNPYSNANDQFLAQGTKVSPAGAPQSSGSFWTSMLDFANKNEKLLGGAMQGIGSGWQAQKKFETDQRYLDQRQQQLDWGKSAATYAPGLRPSATPGIINGGRA